MSQWPRVQPGQPFKIQASLQNRLIELASQRRVPGVGQSAPTGASFYHTDVLGLNTEDSYIPAFGIARATASAIDPAENLSQFLERPLLALETEASAGGEGALVIATNRIEPGGVRPVCIAGVIQARINVTDVNHVAVEPSASVSWRIDSAAEGRIPILWKEDGLGTKWAYLMLGQPSADPTGNGSGSPPGGGATALAAIITGSSPVAGGEDEFEYTCRRAITGGNESSAWSETGDTITAYNTAERVPFTGFAAAPIATGTGVLLFSIDGQYYFSLSNVEGTCS